MRTFAHLSDLHFGRVDPTLEEALLGDLHEVAPDLVVVSGDLTQRARRWQFAAARAFLDRLPAPHLVVPGNHDIPLYDLVRRAARPLHRYRSMIQDELSPTYLDDELAVLGLTTARAAAWTEGRISRQQIEAIRWLGTADTGRLRVLVTHHPFIPPPGGRRPPPLVGRGADALRIAAESGVDLCLGGHLHLSYSGNAATYNAGLGRSIVVAQASTAISSRRRGEPNGYNLVHADGGRLELDARAAAGTGYTSLRRTTFERSAAGWEPVA